MAQALIAAERLPVIGKMKAQERYDLLQSQLIDSSKPSVSAVCATKRLSFRDERYLDIFRIEQV